MLVVLLSVSFTLNTFSRAPESLDHVEICCSDDWWFLEVENRSVITIYFTIFQNPRYALRKKNDLSANLNGKTLEFDFIFINI